MAQARSFFSRAIALDPQNIEAAVEQAAVDLSVASAFIAEDWAAHYEAAEKGIINVLSFAPNHAKAHTVLGAVQMQSNRVAQGISQCEQALALDHNLAAAHGFIGLGKYLMGRGDDVEAHIQEALRLSPRDTRAFLWMMFAGLGKLEVDADLEAVAWFRRSLEANQNQALSHFHAAAALGLVGDLKEARSAARAGLALDPNFTIRRYRVSAKSDNSIYLTKRERIYEGMRRAGLPEG
jgi:tetratricopeptide (TPR) repeat protein